MLKLFFTQIIFCHPQTSKNLEENSLKKIYKENLHWISEQEFFNPIPVEGSLHAVGDRLSERKQNTTSADSVILNPYLQFLGP